MTRTVRVFSTMESPARSGRGPLPEADLSINAHLSQAQGMNDTHDETAPNYFSYVRNLNGDLEPVGFIRRNGRSVPRLAVCPEQRGDRDLAEFIRFYREITYSLSRLERRTWIPLLLGWTIDDLAQSEGVSRQAIYERIRGSSQGYGGMIRKNDYVAIWWRTQRKKGNRHE